MQPVQTLLEGFYCDKCLAAAVASLVTGAWGRFRDSLGGRACTPPKAAKKDKAYVFEYGVWGVSEVLASSGVEVEATALEPVRELELKARLSYPRLLGPKLERIVEEAASIFLEALRTPLKKLYPGDDIEGYVWVRVVKCPGGSEAPVIGDPIIWEERRLALYYEGEVFRVVRVSSLEKARRELATVRGRVVRCPDGSVMTVDDARKAYKRVLDSWSEGKWGLHPLKLAAVKTSRGFEDAGGLEDSSESLLRALAKEWPYLASRGLIPSDPLPYSPLKYYGVDVAYKMFTARQLLAHAEAIKALRRARKEVEASYGSNAGEAAATYIVLAYLEALAASTAFTPWDQRRGAPGRLKMGVRGLTGLPRIHGEAHLPLILESVARNAVMLARRTTLSNGDSVTSKQASLAVAYIRVDVPLYGAVPYSSWALRALSAGTPPIGYRPSLEALTSIASLVRIRGVERLVVAVEGGPRRLLYIVDELLERGWSPRIVGVQYRLWNMVLETVKVEPRECLENPSVWSKLSEEASRRAALKVKQGLGAASAAVSSVIEAIGVVASKCWPITSYTGARLSTGHIASRIIGEVIASTLSETLAIRLPPLDSLTLLYLSLISEGPVSREAYSLLSKLLGVEPESGLRCCFREKGGLVRPVNIKEATPPKESLLRRLKGGEGHIECIIIKALERMGFALPSQPACSAPLPLQGAT